MGNLKINVPILLLIQDGQSMKTDTKTCFSLIFSWLNRSLNLLIHRFHLYLQFYQV